MLDYIGHDIYPYGSQVGFDIAYRSREGNEGLERLRKHANALDFEMWIRSMKESTYNMLANGTHPIYQQARELGLNIGPETRRQ